MTMMRLLKTKHANLLAAAKKIHERAEVENRLLTNDEQSKWDRLLGELDTLNARIDETNQMRNEIAGRTMHGTEADDWNTPEPIFDRTGGKPHRYGDWMPGDARIVAPRLQAFRNTREAFDCGLWFKSRLLSHTSRHPEGEAAKEKLIGRRGEGWFASQNESEPTDGGYLVPPSFDNAVQVYREQVGVMRRLARVVQMGSDTWTGFKQTSGTSVYYPGEEGEITASDANFARYTLTAKKRAILAYISNELRDDSLPGIMDLLAQDMGHQFALKEDQEGVVGDGTSTYGGVQGLRPAVIDATASVATADSGDSTWETLDLDDFYGAMSLLADKYRGLPLSWLVSGPFKWQAMDRLALAQGGSVTSDVIDGVRVATFLGYPVAVSDRMPTTTAVSQVCALFGAFANAVIIGDRGGVRIATSEHVAFTSDRIAVRGTTRYDIHVHEEGDTATAGAIVGLKTAAS